MFGDGIRLALSGEVSIFIVSIQMENVAYKLFVYHSEDNMIFLILNREEMASLQLISYFSAVSLRRVFTLVSSRQVDGVAVCQLMWCIHVSQSR